MKISICIPTYNQAAYIELAVLSAFQQSLKPFEIIVSDDCSTDNTPNILQTLAEQIPILKIYRQPHNMGIAVNVDTCLRLASGDFVVRLDSDDQLLPLFTEKLSTLLMEFPQAGYAHAAIREIDQSGNFLNERRLIRKTGYKSGDDALKDALKGYRVAANILMYRRTALETVDFLTGLPNFGEDYHMTTAISSAGFGNAYLNEVLAYYRVWVDVAKVRQKRKLAEINGVRRVFDEILEPAFIKRGWGTGSIRESRKSFALRQSDCLGWDIYSSDEKSELRSELYKISSASGVKLFAWLYEHKFGVVLGLYSSLKSIPKSIIKKSILKLQPLKTK